VRLDWRLTAADKNTLRRSLEIIGAELGRAALGRLKIDLGEGDNAWPEVVQDGGHHIGTTRMHVDPKQGVVDGNCRVHGLANLFVAGSSVFPTSGHANPTLTIVALALRLGAHVGRLMA
jgi:choline dehydrogenase-like flavoprotein